HVPRETVKLAEHILDSKAGRFDPSKFKDEYETALKKLVQRKAKGGKIEEPEEQPERSNVVNLMDWLRAGLKGGRQGGGPSSGTRATARRRNGKAARRRKAA